MRNLSSGISSSKLTSYLSTARTETGTTLGESGLEVFLEANSAYIIDAKLLTTSSGDGIKWAPYYSGVLTLGNTVGFSVAAGVESILGIEDEVTDATSNAVWHWQGLIRTSSSGRLYILVAKNTDNGGDTSIVSGSYLTAVLV